MAAKLLNLLALATIAIFASSHGPAQAAALSADPHNFVRHNPRHHTIARRVAPTPRTRKRCKVKTSSVVVVTESSAPVVVVAPAEVSQSSEAPASSSVALASQSPVINIAVESPAPPAAAPASSSPVQVAPAASSFPPEIVHETQAPAPAVVTSSSRAVATSSVWIPPQQVDVVTTTSAPAPAPTTTSEAIAAVTTQALITTPNGSRKVGIAWNNPNVWELNNFLSDKVSAVYTWSPYKPEALNGNHNVEFVPMIWGEKQLDAAKRLIVPGYATTVLGFNEPDQGGQANINPWHAAELWKAHIQPLASQGYRLISPAPTNAPAGTEWLKNFMNACTGCTVDAMAAHWYGTSTQNFIDHITMYHTTWNRPVWVTEFACQNFSGGQQCTVDQIWSFIRTVTDFMDHTPWVEKYFAFGVLHDMSNVNRENTLMSNDGTPSPLGWEYLS